MHVAIIGGTGFVGSYIVDELLSQGHEVSMLVRPDSEIKVRQPDAVNMIGGTVDNVGSICELVAGCDAVIYCVGILREIPRNAVTFELTQYEGVANTVKAAGKCGVNRFILMSANGVKESGTQYQATKKRAEDLLLTSDLDATILRPSVIFGDPRGLMEFATQLYRDMVKPPIPAIGFFSGSSPARGAVRMSPVHVEDVARAFVSVLFNETTVGKTFVLGGPESVSWTEMIRRIGTATGKNKWIIPFPISLMKAAAVAFDWLPAFPVTRDQLTMLAEGNTADPGSIESLTGAAPVAFEPAHLTYLRN